MPTITESQSTSLKFKLASVSQRLPTKTRLGKTQKTVASSLYQTTIENYSPKLETENLTFMYITELLKRICHIDLDRALNHEIINQHPDDYPL